MTEPVPHVGNRWSGVSVLRYGTNMVRRAQHDNYIRRQYSGALISSADNFFWSPTLHGVELLLRGQRRRIQ